jgi:hypothetical protein
MLLSYKEQVTVMFVVDCCVRELKQLHFPHPERIIRHLKRGVGTDKSGVWLKNTSGCTQTNLLDALDNALLHGDVHILNALNDLLLPATLYGKAQD